MSHKRYRVGIDIGGTFTDLVLIDEEQRKIELGKLLTTPHRYLEAAIEGLDQLLADSGLTHSDLGGVVHGTTLVTNTVIERKGSQTALVATKGTRDLLEIGGELRYDIYDLGILRPEPLVPRHLRREVSGRLSATGATLAELDLDALPAIVDDFRREDVKSIAVCLMHSYANTDHEDRVGEALARLFPEATVTLSSHLVPEIREYERVSTTVVNAYVHPLVKSYLTAMEAELEQRNTGGPMHLMLSNGGLASVEEAVAAPVMLIESGPAGGVMAACYFGELVGCPNLISFDMGGTTAKMSLVDGGEPVHSHEFEAGRMHRFKKGSGLALRVPVIDMIEIGAGGGSIARIDQMGLLKVGPDSAGANPGPASYGLGGAEPTVTDADLVLGYLDPEFFLGGGMKLDKAAAHDAIDRQVASPLKFDVVRAAAGINEIVNESMAVATRLHVAERGRDLRNYALLAFGGAGPVHAYRLAQLLGIKRLICPFAAGAASALGFLVAPLSVAQVRSYLGRLDSLDWDRVNALFASMEQEAEKKLSKLGIPVSEIQYRRSADMRFAGQGYEVESSLPAGELGAERASELEEVFFKAYGERFDRVPSGMRVEALTWRLVASSPRPSVELSSSQVESGPVQKGSRPVYFNEVRDMVDTPVFDRYRLVEGTEITGPAVIEERESTVIVGPGAMITVDRYRNLDIALP